MGRQALAGSQQRQSCDPRPRCWVHGGGWHRVCQAGGRAGLLEPWVSQGQPGSAAHTPGSSWKWALQVALCSQGAAPQGKDSRTRVPGFESQVSLTIFPVQTQADNLHLGPQFPPVKGTETLRLAVGLRHCVSSTEMEDGPEQEQGKRRCSPIASGGLCKPRHVPRPFCRDRLGGLEVSLDSVKDLALCFALSCSSHHGPGQGSDAHFPQPCSGAQCPLLGAHPGSTGSAGAGGQAQRAQACLILHP